jgi:hypothetical protein
MYLLKSSITDSTRTDAEAEPGLESQMKFVTQERMQTLDSDLTSRRASGSSDNFPHDVIWVLTMSGQALWFTLVTNLRTFESPKMEKTLSWDVILMWMKTTLIKLSTTNGWSRGKPRASEHYQRTLITKVMRDQIKF